MTHSDSSEPSRYDTVQFGLITAGAGGVQAAMALAGGFAAPLVAALFVSGQLLFWAGPLLASENDGAFITAADCRKESGEFFETDKPHVAICGPAGSGKSSLINALRGLRNSEGDAASTGSAETTTHRQKYQSHLNIKSLFLYDFPGAGTQRIPAKNYYGDQKLELFDLVLIVQGERLGEIEIDIIKHCIRRHQRFLIICSRSDDVIRRVADDKDLGIVTAKNFYRETAENAVANQLWRAKVLEKAIKELMGFCVSINTVWVLIKLN